MKDRNELLRVESFTPFLSTDDDESRAVVEMKYDRAQVGIFTIRVMRCGGTECKMINEQTNEQNKTKNDFDCNSISLKTFLQRLRSSDEKSPENRQSK